MNGWIGVDLDGTLAYYTEWKGETSIGEPIPKMVERVKSWLASGIEVRILTARVSPVSTTDIGKVDRVIREWCKKHIGQELKVTSEKDYMMIEFWDDRCVQVVPNTGVALRDLLEE